MTSAVTQPRPSLGEILVLRGRLDEETLARALALQEGREDRLGMLLVDLGFAGEREVAEALAEQLQLEFVSEADYPDEPLFVESVSAAFLSSSRAVPIGEEGDNVVLAMADPLDDYAVAALELALGRSVIRRVALTRDVTAAIARHEAASSRDGSSGGAQETGHVESGSEGDVQRLRDLASDAPVIRAVDAIVRQALAARASDIHIEPFERRLRVRLRVDGLLREVSAPQGVPAEVVISRVKVVSDLDIAESRLPQDGRLRYRVEGREIDMRVSTVPTRHGESVVLRILDRGQVPLDLAHLGFGALLDDLEDVLDRPDGIVLVTGPTGSGKTTTLYAALHRLNTIERKILTVEDPVEYELEGINQIQVKSHIGLDFADALRSILRQDPDVIMIGEMRDLETARIAVQAALTGHKVFSTLHTNDAPSSVTRLLDIGVEPYLVTSTVSGILAQRLVRTLCEHCREARPLSSSLRASLGARLREVDEDAVLYHARGCAQCEDSGYRGRLCLGELLRVDDAVREAVLARADAGAIRRAAPGFRDMFQDGLGKALAGLTTLEEVARVTGGQ